MTIVAMVLIGLLFLTLLYAIRTLIGMRHKTFYPLIRLRRSDGSVESASIQSLQIPSAPHWSVKKHHTFTHKEER